MRFAITLLLILALAAAAFLVGWLELSLPAGTYGVAFTKSGGWDEEVIAPGGITWRWERLIPTNMTLHLFDLTPHAVSLRMTAHLPSAELYAAEVDIDADEFSYDLGIVILLRLRTDHLPGLVAKEGLRPETLSAWYEQATSGGGDTATAALLSNEAAVLVMDPQPLEEIVRRRLEQQHPELEIIDVELTPFSIPDRDLYLLAKTAVAARLDAQQRARSVVAADLALMREQARQHAASLRELGRTLAEFPELIDLLSHSAADLLAQVLGMANATALPDSQTQLTEP